MIALIRFVQEDFTKIQSKIIIGDFSELKFVSLSCHFGLKQMAELPAIF